VTATRSLLCFAALATAALAAGCDDTAGGRLGGSVYETYNLTYNTINIKKQVVGGTFQAMIVEYVNKTGGCGNACEIPVKVVINAPISAGEKKDLAKDGSVTRVMKDNSQFPDLDKGNITFHDLPDVGGEAEGEFYATFVGGTTLNGDFSGTVQLLGNE
jgi:hypothetical protein